MSQNPHLTAKNIEDLARLLEADISLHPMVLSRQEVARWMDADERFASWVKDNQPELYERCAIFRHLYHELSDRVV